jgi:ubiquinone/menaquinone biosynthesis C-methylase UbiE
MALLSGLLSNIRRKASLAPATLALRGNSTTSSSANIKGIQEEFTRQASGFERDWNKRSKRNTNEIMAWALGHISIPPAAKKCLDVAAGTCIFARAIASTGKIESVVALDATEAMLEEGRQQCIRENISNIKFVVGDAGHIPYPDNSFDMVVCRLCIHHFDAPIEKIKEMARVLKPGGLCVVVDIISRDDEEVAKEQNRLEILRDPSHTRMLTLPEMTEYLRSAGLNPTLPHGSIPTIINKMDLHGWMDSTRTPAASRIEIEQAIGAELLGRGRKTGFQPDRSEDDSRIYFEHVYAVVQAVK